MLFHNANLHKTSATHKILSMIFTKEKRHKNEYGIYKCVHRLKEEM